MFLTEQKINGKPRPDDHLCWHDRAEELARWTMDHLVNRRDVWGGYCLLDGRVQRTTRPAKKQRGFVRLTLADLTRHYQSHSTEGILGLHTTSLDNLSKWGAIDIDQHNDLHHPHKATEQAALAWYARLCEMGFHPLLTTSDGRGGYHLRLILTEPTSTHDVYAFLQALIVDHAENGLTAPPETFPKQASLKTPYGNWLRLPGRHHRRDHWSTVWDGKQWLSGSAAVSFVLSLTGDSPSLLSQDSSVRDNSLKREKTPHATHHTLQVFPDETLQCFPSEVQSAIAQTLPTGPGMRNRRIFDLARLLKAIEGLDTSSTNLRAIVKEWHKKALPRINTKDFGETWVDFVNAWERVKCLPGQSFAVLLEQAKAAATPPECRDYEGSPGLLLLAKTCRALQEIAGPDQLFFLSTRQAATIAGTGVRKALSLLRVLQFDGIIELVVKGEQGKSKGGMANQWRYTGQSWSTAKLQNSDEY